MADLKGLLSGVGTLLTGTAMGMQGRGAEFAQGLEQNRLQDEERRRAKNQELEQTLAIGGRVTLNALKAGDIQNAFDFLSKGISGIKEQHPDYDLNDALSIATMIRTGKTDEAIKALSMADQQNQLRGLVPEIKPDSADAGSKGFQFGATETYKDSEGNMFTATQKRDPATGQVEQVVVPIDSNVEKPIGKLQEVGSYGLTAREKLAQLGGEESVKQSAKIISEYKQSGLKARGLIKDTERLLELNKLISTGRTGPAKKAFMNLFNIKDENAANLGEFDAKAGQLVLGMIKQLGANPTEGERAFLQEISPSLQQGSAINEAILKDLLKVQQRQYQRAKWLAENKGASIDDLLLMTEDFKPTAPEEAQQEPQPNTVFSDMSDDDLLRF